VDTHLKASGYEPQIQVLETERALWVEYRLK
jgi:hypothetical protein